MKKKLEAVPVEPVYSVEQLLAYVDKDCYITYKMGAVTRKIEGKVVRVDTSGKYPSLVVVDEDTTLVTQGTHPVYIREATQVEPTPEGHKKVCVSPGRYVMYRMDRVDGKPIGVSIPAPMWIPVSRIEGIELQ